MKTFLLVIVYIKLRNSRSKSILLIKIFTLSTYLYEPEVLKLKLTKSAIKDDEIKFFADKGITNFKTSLKRFSFDAKVNGSIQQDILNKYEEAITKFSNQNLILLKNQMEHLLNTITHKFKQEVT